MSEAKPKISNDKIEKLAKQAGLAKHGLGWTAWESQLEKFARLVFSEALEWQRSQCEPVAWMNPHGGLIHKIDTGHERKFYTIPIYTSPPAAQINQQLLEALEKIAALKTYGSYEGEEDTLHDARIIANTALAAAKEQA